MRDLLPGEAERQSALSKRIMASFELFGYERVVVPAFEYADVLERGLGALEADAVLRFVEPETGEVVALRPDMTPQVARLLATRLADVPGPARLAYLGTVLRRRRERARQNRQIPQAGIELVGREGPTGDLEVLSVATAAVRAAGLAEFVLDLGDARIVASLLAPLPRPRWPALVEALAVKDTAALYDRATESGLQPRDAAALAELPELHGGAELWPRAARVLGGTAAEPALRELETLWRRATELEIAPKLIVDFGETWNFEYYTGPMFQILAEGPGAPVGSGGRYDGLLERFGAPRAAAGFAVDLDYLEWALKALGASHQPRVRLLLSAEAEFGRDVMHELRQRGVPVAPAPDSDAFEYAVAWRYSHWLRVEKGGTTLTCVPAGERIDLSEATPAQLAARVAARVTAQGTQT
jgi:ATP phosphoribosyltransferase regulatory subunit